MVVGALAQTDAADEGAPLGRGAVREGQAAPRSEQARMGCSRAPRALSGTRSHTHQRGVPFWDTCERTNVLLRDVLESERGERILTETRVGPWFLERP